MIARAKGPGARRAQGGGRPARRSLAAGRGRAMLAIGLAALWAAVLAPAPAAAASAEIYGPFGPESQRLRERLWILPGAEAAYPLRATVFRPADPPGKTLRRPLVVINHGTSDATRLAVAMPVYYWLSRWFVDRGYVVVLPQRRGHGATAGPLAEAIGGCTDPDHYRSGMAAADDIEAALAYMSAQPFAAPGETLVVGISSGGWASLALAARNPAGVRGVINIAGGRGGRAFGRTDGSVCGERRLVEAARAYGRAARVPTLWLYAANDSYFRPALAEAMAAAWQEGGGAAELHILGPYGADGHTLADDRAGWDVWGTALERFLDRGDAAVASLDAAPPAAAPAEAVTPARAEGRALTEGGSLETGSVTEVRAAPASDGDARSP